MRLRSRRVCSFEHCLSSGGTVPALLVRVPQACVDVLGEHGIKEVCSDTPRTLRVSWYSDLRCQAAEPWPPTIRRGWKLVGKRMRAPCAECCLQSVAKFGRIRSAVRGKKDQVNEVLRPAAHSRCIGARAGMDLLGDMLLDWNGGEDCRVDADKGKQVVAHDPVAAKKRIRPRYVKPEAIESVPANHGINRERRRHIFLPSRNGQAVGSKAEVVAKVQSGGARDILVDLIGDSSIGGVEVHGGASEIVKA